MNSNPIAGTALGRRNARQLVREGERGLTLIELIVTVFILSILASAAIPVASFRSSGRKSASCATICG